MKENAAEKEKIHSGWPETGRPSFTARAVVPLHDAHAHPVSPVYAPCQLHVVVKRSTIGTVLVDFPQRHGPWRRISRRSLSQFVAVCRSSRN
jgi:hypothetical protein